MKNFINSVLEAFDTLNFKVEVKKGDYFEDDDSGREGESFEFFIDGVSKYTLIPGTYTEAFNLVSPVNHDKLYEDGSFPTVDNSVRNPYADHDYESDGGSSRFEFTTTNPKQIAMAIVVFELESKIFYKD